MRKPEFTDREKLLLAYFRDRNASNPRRGLLYNLGLISAAIALAAIGYLKEDIGWLYVAGLILVYEQGRSAISGYQYSDTYRSIYEKYEAAVEAMTDGRHSQDANPQTDRSRSLPGQN